MAKHKAVYESAHGATRKLTAFQKIAEIVCERQAANKGQQLPTRFWNISPWDRAFKMQINLAQGLLKIYSAAAIMRALQTDEGKKIYSLSAPWLDPLIQKEEAKLKVLDEQAKKSEPVEVSNPMQAPRAPASSGKSIRGRLKGL